MRPRIALTTGLSRVDLGRADDRYDGHPQVPWRRDGEHVQVRGAYYEAVERGGGEPIVLPPLAEGDPPSGLLDIADGLLLTGGEDLDSALWGEPKHPRAELIDKRRQDSDFRLLAFAEARGMPVFGICLGCQEIAVHRGGRLIQHVPDEPAVEGPHRLEKSDPASRHAVSVEPGSLLAEIVGLEPLATNSRHHQAVREAGRGLRVSARCGDRVIEAIEDATPGLPGRRRGTSGGFLLGVQWHPEDLTDQPRHLALFQALCRAAEAWRTQR